MSSVSQLMKSVRKHDEMLSGGSLGRLITKHDRNRRDLPEAQDTFKFKLVMGCFVEKEQDFSIDDWGYDDEAWEEMNESERLSIVESKLVEWKAETIEECLEEWLRNNCSADYS
jgi:hypothetical protein